MTTACSPTRKTASAGAKYLLRVKDLASGSLLDDTIENAEPSIVWAGDTSRSSMSKRTGHALGFRVRRHVLGTGVALDPIVWETDRHHFYTDISESKSCGATS